MTTSTDQTLTNESTRQLALIIGNSDYHMGDHLPNALHDAKEMFSVLKNIGFLIFDNKEHIDLKQHQFQKTILDFQSSINENDILVLYYSGHGRQWKNKNYLIPIDNSLEDRKDDATTRIELHGSDLEFYAIDLEALLKNINENKPFATFVFLECSRYYYFRDEKWELKPLPQGMTSMHIPINSLITFSCLPDHITNIEHKDSIFTKSPVKHLQIPNRDIRTILSDVTKEVLNETNSEQNPYVSSTLTHTNICLFQQKQIKFQQWKQHATTVAGGNRSGSQANQLRYPHGIFIDKNNWIYIADLGNHRIIKCRCYAKEGQIIAGRNGLSNEIDELRYPTDVVFDEKTQSLIIADIGNKRVLVCSNYKNEQISIDDILGWSLTVDKKGSIYISDVKKHEVIRWKKGEMHATVVAGGNGIGDQLNQLNYPTFIFVDEHESVYISDWKNHRVTKCVRQASESIAVAGGNGEGSNLNQLRYPQGLFVDQYGRIYIADFGNDRIMRWCEGKNEGEIVVGGNGNGNQSNQLKFPTGLSFDSEGNLYVADSRNHRIQKFEIIQD